MTRSHYPELPYGEWKKAKTTLHLFAQIVGRVRLSLMPPLNHWWHVTLYVSSRGLTTSAIPWGDGSFEMEFDFIDHQLVIRTSEGQSRRVELEGVTVAEFYRRTMAYLHELDVNISILQQPFDPERVGSTIRFGEDTRHAQYDPLYVHRFWQILIGINGVFTEFRGQFLGKCSPVHFFWHSFDLAVTRFSGRPAEVSPDADPVTREAYSHEVISAGFWPGDENLAEPTFYSYVHPEPEDLAKQPLLPSAAWWQEQNGAHMALYRYDDFRKAHDPREDLLAFLQSSYEAGANLADWSRSDLER